MKDTVILLIFLLSVLGLLIGVHYTEDISDDTTLDDDSYSVDEDIDSDITITLEKKEKDDLSKYFT